MSTNLSQTVTWVPVSERLPEKRGIIYHAALNDGSIEDVPCAMFDICGVTHWAEPLKHPAQLEAEEKAMP